MTHPAGPTLHMAAPGPMETSTAARTVSGRVVPFGPVGRTSIGLVSWSTGSLQWSPDLRRIKLLTEHNQGNPVGYCVAMEDRPDGLWATFHIPEGEAGNRALADAQAGLRDAFSVGAQLDAVTGDRLRAAAAGASVAASGTLREVSLVSVPAFDDARVDSVAASAGPLVVSAWSDPEPQPERPTVTDPTPTQQPAAQPTTTTTTTTPAQPAQPATQPAVEPGVQTDTGPAVVQAQAGAALVTGEPSTYNFNGSGPSMCVDAVAAAGGDSEARERMARFNAELENRNVATEMALAAVLTRSPVPAPFLPPQATLSPVLLAINRGRPLASRLTPTPIRNAQPFGVPVVGGFTGVGDHTEGTPHVTEGTLTLGDATITPKAISGAYRISRELIDSSNPAIDQIALDRMVIAYRATSEARIAAALLAGAGHTTVSVNTVAKLRAAFLAMQLQGDDVPADFAALGAAMYTTITGETDTTGRPMVSPPSVTVNSAASTRGGIAGVTIDTSEVVPSSKIPTATGYIVRADAVLWAETAAQTFRLEQPEGPGIVKLAIWGYGAAAVLDGTGVEKIQTAA